MSEHRQFIFHKPFGYLSQFINNMTKRKNKKLLGELIEVPEGSMAIGRLDENSEGLLLLTTDGQVSADIGSGKYEKEYYCQVDGIITNEAIQQLRDGIEIGIRNKRYQTLACKVTRLDPEPVFETRKKLREDRHGPTSWISITLREGKFRQIRKMTAATGFPTLRLVRVRIGGIHLDSLRVGEMIEVDNFKI